MRYEALNEDRRSDEYQGRSEEQLALSGWIAFVCFICIVAMGLLSFLAWLMGAISR